MIIITSVLFNQLGLREAIESVIRYKFRIISCPKCCTFWCCFFYLIWNTKEVLFSITISFISCYVAIWLVLLIDFLTIKYNKFYEQFENKETKADKNNI